MASQRRFGPAGESSAPSAETWDSSHRARSRVNVVAREVPGFPVSVAVAIDESLYLADWRRQTTLIVCMTEDNVVNATVVEAQLASLGCTCDVAVDGEDALTYLAHECYDAVLMDCMLPGISGYEATRVWRAREAQEGRPHLPIIALTANALASNVTDAREAGMDDFLTKPCSVDELRSALVRATEHRRQSPPAESESSPPAGDR
ncbi:MAG TPA: response regulator [Devosia sp.]